MRSLVASLLLIAAILKGAQLVSDPTTSLGSTWDRTLLPLQIAMELGLGLFVLSGLYWRLICWMALLLFTLFAAYSAYLAVNGAASCGCFGLVKIHPWWMFVLDLAVVTGLAWSIFHSRLQPSLPTLPQPKLIVAGAVSLAVLAVVVLVRYSDNRAAIAESLLPNAGNLTILEPETWVGQPLPIAAAIDLDLSRGQWIVLLHRHDCPHCQEAVPLYEDVAMQAEGTHVALVEVPPYGDAAAESPCKLGRLKNDREWFVQTPVEIQLIDGIVTSASTELPAILNQ